MLPHRYDKTSICDAQGVSALAPGHVAILVAINDDVLRGSGRPLAPVAGSILNVDMDEHTRFHSRNGLSVTSTFLGTSFGPSAGSIQALAEVEGAKCRDHAPRFQIGLTCL